MQEGRPAVIGINTQIAAPAINEFLARLHPFRYTSNSEFSSVRTSFIQGEHYHAATPCGRRTHPGRQPLPSAMSNRRSRPRHFLRRAGTALMRPCPLRSYRVCLGCQSLRRHCHSRGSRLHWRVNHRSPRYRRVFDVADATTTRPIAVGHSCKVVGATVASTMPFYVSAIRRRYAAASLCAPVRPTVVQIAHCLKLFSAGASSVNSTAPPIEIRTPARRPSAT
jgi:hypothetical protein